MAEEIQTKENKDLKIRQANHAPHLYEVYFENGGELPAKLAGALFTDTNEAQEAIRNYLENRRERLPSIKKIKKTKPKGE